ncbi:hypothetical protein BBK36DRAFT_1110503 [Trichoderma citrinoviride]|uniref:Uncharacterized protein n=1 Tax=Trichoderma citrinoviride TaxID=58853 RepID=A0A2T4BJR5_9HYPO|nr:hypothetical protein BBK36DRAFT_1110503 [Trichoderma citrinoviride]PTB69556.1 hypothetical protein BBK36DRAFT_1110503 [Trichoderma citrinoviride]
MPSSDPLAGLNVSISQGTTSPPSIVATVKNNNPHPVTIAPYQSPFDGLLLEQGNLFTKPLDYPTIALKRAWPPPADSLVTLGPGESRTAEIVLRHPVPLQQLAGGGGGGSVATVKLRGQWMSVWRRAREEIGEADWDDVSNPDEFSGLYESNSLEIRIA